MHAQVLILVLALVLVLVLHVIRMLTVTTREVCVAAVMGSLEMASTVKVHVHAHVNS